MKLVKMKIENFRGYASSEIVFDENISVIIGKNDVGKSTIMDALEIFFNGENKDAQVKIDIEDLNILCDEEHKEIKITCYFNVGNEEILIDTLNPTCLHNEYLLNENELLEISKVYNCSKTKINSTDLKTYITANYPNIFDKPLVTLRIQELKVKLDEIKEEILNYDEINKTKSAEIRGALYKYYVTENTEFSKVDIDLSKEDAKNIWGNIKTNLPLYFLFKSDRANTDDDSEVQNPLKIATKSALANLENELNKIKETVENEVKIIGKKTIEKLGELDENIAKNLKTELKLKPWDSIFSFELISDNGIPLNKRGSGVRRLLLLSYFRAEAERISIESNSRDIIYAIEEPETSQHPDYQKMIMETFIKISNNIRHQLIITTHTPEIAKIAKINQLIFIKKEENFSPCIVTDEELKIKDIVKTLGILPSITSKLVICVEGENDVNFIKNINKAINEYKNIIDIESEGINIIPLTGSNLMRWVDENYLKGSDVKEIHIYDNDREDYRKKIDEINNIKDGRRYGWLTKKREMENYISPNLIKNELAITIDDEINWSDSDIPKLLVGKIMTHIKDEKEREKIIKNKLNNSLTKKITKEHLKEIGAFEELEQWFLKIKTIYEN